MRKKYKIGLVIVGFLLLITIALAFMYFLHDSKRDEATGDNATVVTTGKLSLNFSDGEVISTKTLVPGSSISKKFSISNAGDETIYFGITLNSVINDFDYNEDIIIEVYDLITNTLLNKIPMLMESGKIVDYLEIEAGLSRKFEVILSYADGANNVNSSKNKKVSAAINVSFEEKKITTFKEMILANNEIKTESRTQVANDASMVEEGLITNNDEDGTTYYFRGIVKNNYVSFGDYTWRIVRINGDNSVRLIMDDLINNTGSLYKEELVNDEIEDKDDFVNFINSDLYTTLNTWYTTYMSDYDRYVVSGRYCFDDSTTNTLEDEIVDYISYARLMVDRNPTFSCMGTKIENKIGLLSADELVFAGAANNYPNMQYYLYNATFQNSWWLMTPLKFEKNSTITMYDVKIQGNLQGGSLANTYRSIRPVINIDGSLEMMGNGEKDNPYKLVINEE